MSLDEEGLRLGEALCAYEFGGRVADARRYGKGHINDTFRVQAEGPAGARRFILQRINTHVFPDPAALMDNILAVTGHLRAAISAAGGDPARGTLTVVPTAAGGPVYTAGDGGVWRCYPFIENTVCYQSAPTPEVSEEAARAFGRFARLLEGFDATRLHEVLPGFHDTPRRFARFCQVLEADPLSRAAGCRADIEFALARKGDCPVLTDKQAAGALPVRVAHNDTKLNNVLMDPATGEGVCVIDLDTVMPGLWVLDFGDAVRYGANTATEDTRETEAVRFSLPLFDRYAKGYLSAVGGVLTAAEVDTMAWGARIVTLELGLRFLTDYLEGDVYFKTSRPGQNLARCRTQFRLVAGMERQFAAMEEIVARRFADSR